MQLAAKPFLKEISVAPAAGVDLAKYPYNLPVVRKLGRLKFHADVTFFVGENGSGKSTILEAIALALGYGPEGGTKGVSLLKTTESVSPLHQSMKLVKSFERPTDGYFLRAESFFNVATYMDETGYLGGYGSSLHEKSHGEAFLSLLTHKLVGHGLYLLDEPEAALSPQRQLAALIAIHHLVHQASQFIIATHSPILLSYPNAKILRFDVSGIKAVKYEDTEHYSVTRDFLNNYPRRLEQLFGHEE